MYLEDVLNVLGTDNKNLATRSVKQVFSSAVSDCRKGVYRNIRRSISYESSTDGSSYEVATNSEIYGLQQQVISHKEKANALMDTIKLSVNDPYVSSLISYTTKKWIVFQNSRTTLILCTRMNHNIY
jgi:hypothetical protein